MRIVIQNQREEILLRKLLDFLSSQNFELFLEFEDPLSFQLEEVMDELCSSDIILDKDEEPMALSI